MSRNQRVGYVQISMDAGDPGVQREALVRAGCTAIYEDALTKGRKSEWPEWERCRKTLRAGDTLVVWRLDRLGRGLSELIRVVTELAREGIGFESITERIDTSTATGKLVFHIFGALAEFERSLTLERTAAGLAAARARGRKGGRPRVPQEKINAAVTMYLEKPDTTPAAICKIFGISETTLYKYAKEAKQAKQTIELVATVALSSILEKSRNSD